MAVFIPDIFSGYLSGIRTANQDNWQDLTNYNSVQQGQLNNAFSMAAFSPAVANVWNQSYRNMINAQLDAANAPNLMSYADYLRQFGFPELQARAQAAALQYQIDNPGGVPASMLNGTDGLLPEEENKETPDPNQPQLPQLPQQPQPQQPQQQQQGLTVQQQAARAAEQSNDPSKKYMIFGR